MPATASASTAVQALARYKSHAKVGKIIDQSLKN